MTLGRYPAASIYLLSLLFVTGCVGRYRESGPVSCDRRKNAELREATVYLRAIAHLFDGADELASAVRELKTSTLSKRDLLLMELCSEWKGPMLESDFVEWLKSEEGAG